MNDNELDDLLRSWRDAPDGDDAFRRGVWRRVEVAEQPKPAWIPWPFAAAWRAPLGAAAIIAVSAWLGFHHAETEPAVSDASAAYVQSISPFHQGHARP